MQTFTLNNGVQIPVLGFGVFQIPPAETASPYARMVMLASIAKKHGKSIAQVITRWLTERGIVVLAKSTKPARMAENLAVFDFALDDDDKARIATLDASKSQIISHTEPAMLRQLKEWVFKA